MAYMGPDETLIIACRTKIFEDRERRFFSKDGICARYEREPIKDQLWTADEIAQMLVSRELALTAASVIKRFRFSVKSGHFGPPARTGRFSRPETLKEEQRNRALTTRNLIDLDSAVLRPPEPGQYTFRPSLLVALDFAPYMRARQSSWAYWIVTQGWAVPPEFRAPIIEGTATEVPAPALPSPDSTTKPQQKHNNGGRPPDVRDAAERWYWQKLTEKDRELSLTKLAANYVHDNPKHNEANIRKLIKGIRGPSSG